jgi:Tol biopolymer transport system component
LPAPCLACLLFAAVLTNCLASPPRPAAAAPPARTAPRAFAQEGASSPPVAAAPARRRNGKIAFTSRPNNSTTQTDIFVMNPDGSNVINLTRTELLSETEAAWSPDGTQIAFFRGGRLMGNGLFVMNADGSNERVLTLSPVGLSPAWSPDGAKIAFAVPLHAHSSDIRVIDADGSNQVKLTDNVGNDRHPTWSPDGSQIAFDSASRASGDGIYVMNAGGGNQRKIVDVASVGGAHSPNWSPDGSLIMFSGGLSANPVPASAYLVTPDGNNLSRVNGERDNYDPAWSPDGKKIVFRTHDDLRANIGTINLNGTGYTEFHLNSQIIDSQPAWQPLTGGGDKIVFTSERDGNPEIYVMEADGGNQTNLTNHPAADATPVWSPDGTRVAFTSDRSGRSNLYVMDAGGGNVRAVTHFDNRVTDYRVYDPAWSPDGTKLVFVGSAMGETSGLVIVNADGTGVPSLLAEGSTEVADPAWSPDGTRIAYVGREASPNAEDGVRFHVFVVNTDGNGKTRVAVNPRPFSSFPYPPTASGPAWSPDGARIAYSSGGTIPQIQYVRASGGAPIAVTVHPSAHTQPGWTADNRIVFTSDRDGQREIYATDVDGNIGRPVSRLTQNAAADYDPDPQPDPSLVPQGAPPTVQWRGEAFRVREGAPPQQQGEPLVVTRLGDLSRAASVDYETSDIPDCLSDDGCPRRASERSDYIRTAGTLHFAPGEAAKAVSVPLVDDVFFEGDQLFDLILSNATGATLGAQHTSRVVITDNDAAGTPPAPNPIDEPNFFVRMHYLDFLGREPESAGQEAWVGVWNRCPDINRDERCDRITISSAFFRSLEFQLRGGFVYRLYRVGFNRRPTYAEFVRDTARIGGQTLAQLDAGKDAFALAFTERDEFRALYFGVRPPPGGYVASLEANSGATLTGDVTRRSLEADLGLGRRTHAGVLRAVAEHPNVEAAQYNEAFVTMQYFGYLKRDPEAEGYRNWLRVINRGDGYRVMVNGFVNSVEYRARFGQP